MTRACDMRRGKARWASTLVVCAALALAVCSAMLLPASALALAFDAHRPAPDSSATAARTRALEAALGLPGSAVIDYPGGFRSTTPARLRSGGVGIAIRYVAAAKWKSLTHREADALRAGGVDIAVVYETKASWMLGGRSAGISAAKKARASVIACGGPRTPFVWFACDVPTTRYSRVNACLAGAASVLGADHVGIYGSYDVCAAALKSGYAAKAWQTEAWSRGKVLSTAALFQRAHRIDGSLGIDYDSNLARADDIGQWGYIPPSLAFASQTSSTTATLRAVDFADGMQGWAVGDGGTVRHTTDAGSSWTTQPVPASAQDATLRGVRFVDTERGWAVGDGGAVLHTADGGVTWEPQATPDATTLNAVDFADADHGWAVGDSGTILRTSDGGASWIAASSPSTSTLLDVRFTSPSGGWAVGARGTVLRTTDGGSTWSTQTASTPATLTAIDFAGGTGWIAGSAGTVLRSCDGGSTWSARATGVSADLTGAQLTDAKTGVIVGSAGTVLRSADGGVSFNRLAAGSAHALLAADFLDSRNGWVVGEGGTILRATPTFLSPFGAVTGTVTNALSGAALAGIAVKVGSRLAAPTSPDGSYIGARVSPGTYTVTFSHPLYITASVNGVSVPAADVARVAISLVPKTATALGPPLVMAAAPMSSLPTTIAVNLLPSSATAAAPAVMTAWHYEPKWVKKKIHGKKRRVRVWYWRARFATPMAPLATSTAGARTLVIRRTLARGLWKVQAKFPGSATYLPSTSFASVFAVR